MVTVGQKAPDFIATALVDGQGEVIDLVSRVRASEAVVLLVAPADFVSPCTADWQAVRAAGWHESPDLAVVGLSGDSLFSHAAYADQNGIPFPIVSDFHATVADQYDFVLEEWEGHDHIPGRGVLVVDGEWTVVARETADPLARPDPAPVERAWTALRDLDLDVDQPTVDYDA